MSVREKELYDEVNIVDYEDKYCDDFVELNIAWISKYFTMEQSDYDALNNVQSYIIEKGGYIAVALLHEKVVGVCALIKKEHDIYQYELAKMAVDPSVQGMGIGFLLGKSVIQKAKEYGASRIFLETNDMLTPAIALYKKLGFDHMPKIPSPYERSNVQMELILKNN